jgi:hypothetical protein
MEVDVELLAARPGEPVRRLENYGDLEESIDSVGLLRPIDVAPDLEIVDGHRRWQACMALGKDRIACQIWVGSDGNTLMQSEKNALYSQLNSAQRPFNGKDALASYAKDCVLIGSKSTQANILLARDVLGMPGIKRLVERGYGPDAVVVAKNGVRHSGGDPKDNRQIEKFVWWAVDHRAFNWLRSFVDGHARLDPIKVRELVARNRKPPRAK